MSIIHRLSKLSEAPAQAEHQVVGVLEVVELVAHVEEEAARDERLQRQNLVEAARVLALLDEVAPDADVYREDGHVQLGAEGEAGSKLLAEGRAVELQPVAAGAFDMMRLQVGTFVVLGVEREAGAEVFVDAVHGVEVEARHGKRAGDELGAAVQKEAPFAGGAVEDDVVADARGQRRGFVGMNSGGGSLGRRTAEGAHHTDTGADGVDARVGIVRVTVGVVRQVDARRQAPLRRQLPVQEEAGVDVGVDARADHVVVEVGVGGILLPAEGGAEVPFVVQRQAGSEPRDACALEDVDGRGCAHLVGVEERVPGHADALIGRRIETAQVRLGREAEGVFQVDAQGCVDGALGGVVAPEEAGGGEDVAGAEVDADAVRRAVAEGVGSRLCVESGACRGQQQEGCQQTGEQSLFHGRGVGGKEVTVGCSRRARWLSANSLAGRRGRRGLRAHGGRAVGGHLKLVRRGGARVDEYVGVAAAEEGGEEEGEEQAGFLHVVCSLIGLQRKGFPPISPTVQSNYQHTEVYASGAGVSSAASPSAVVVPLERCL